MKDKTTLLSICIPTYNRASFLKVMLKALLPQSEKYCGDVEVLVSDNASTDETETVVKEYQLNYSLSYIKNDENLGVIANILNLPLYHAKGKYVWILGDHNLLNIKSLDTLIAVLRKNTEREIFYANFNCAKYPDHWPEKIEGMGFLGEIESVGNNDLSCFEIDQWNQVLDVKSSYGTQLYAHIISADYWRSFWERRAWPSPFRSVAGTYPHSYMIAKSLFNLPSYYIGTPLITIFNGAQHWGSISMRLKTDFFGLPGLIALYKRNGLSREKYKEAKEWSKERARKDLQNYFELSDRSDNILIFQGIFRNFLRPYLFFTVLKTYVVSECNWSAKFLSAIAKGVRNTYLYVFFNCRPARIIRKRL